MSEHSLRTQSKKGAVREALISKAAASLAEVKEEESKLVAKIGSLACQASDSYASLVANKFSGGFNQMYGDCVSKIQNNLSYLQEISHMLDECSALSDELGEVHSETCSHQQQSNEPSSSHDAIDKEEQVGPMLQAPDSKTLPKPLPNPVVHDRAPEGTALGGNVKTEKKSTTPDPENNLAKEQDSRQTAASATPQPSFHEKLLSLYKKSSLTLEEETEALCGFHQGPNTLWLQTSPATIDNIAEIICMGLSNDSFKPYTRLPMVGDIVLAKFHQDEFYYRAVVESLSTEDAEEVAEVFFIDFGNTEEAPLNNLLHINEELLAIPPQAHLCSLAAVSPPSPAHQYSDAAISWFEGLIVHPLKAKFFLCAPDIPVLLATVRSKNKDLSSFMLRLRHAIRVSNEDFKQKYLKMPKGMREFYSSVQPELIKKNRKVFRGAPFKSPPKDSLSKAQYNFNMKQPTLKEPPPPAEVVAADRIYLRAKRKVKSGCNTDIAKKVMAEMSVGSSEVLASRSAMVSPEMPSSTEKAASVMAPASHLNQDPITVTTKETSQSMIQQTADGSLTPVDIPGHGKSKRTINAETMKQLRAASQRLSDKMEKEEVSSKKIHPKSVASADKGDVQPVSQAKCKDMESLQAKALSSYEMVRELADWATGAESLLTAMNNGSGDNEHGSAMLSKNSIASAEKIERDLVIKSSSPVKLRSQTTKSSSLESSSGDGLKPVEESAVSEKVRGQLMVDLRSYPPTPMDATSTVPKTKTPPADCSTTNNSFSHVGKDHLSFGCTVTKNESQNFPIKEGLSSNCPIKEDVPSKYPITVNISFEELCPASMPSSQRPVTEGKSCVSNSLSGDSAENIGMANSADALAAKIQTTCSAPLAVSVNSLEAKEDPSHSDSLHDVSAVVSDVETVLPSPAVILQPADTVTSLANQNISDDQQENRDDSNADDSPGICSPIMSGQGSPQCLLFPPNCSGTTLVPEQVLEITQTNEPKPVIMSYINTPTDFYVNLCNTEAADHFNKLDELDDYYKRVYNTMLRSIVADYKAQVGDYCVAQSDQFNAYYRAEVLDFKDAKDILINDLVVQKKHKSVKVFFIDYGSSEWVSDDAIFPLMPQFGNMPPLAWHCSLIDVYPLEGCKAEYSGGWDKEAVAAFKSLIQEGGACKIYIANPRTKMHNETLQVLLQTTDKELYVNEELVNQGVVRSLYLQGESSVIENSALLDERTQDDLSQPDNPAQAEAEHEMVSHSRVDEIDEWNPMSDDFFSHSNMFSLNPDDAEVILTGYKSIEPSRAPCRQYVKKGYCTRGERCPYEHTVEREGAVTEDTKEVFSSDITVTLPKENVFYVVERTATVSPSHFYVKFPYGTRSIREIVDAEASEAGSSQGKTSNPEVECEQEDFSEFQRRLNDHYLKAPFIRNDSVAYALGEIIVAKFTEDETFYRARIVDSDFDNRMVEVFFVDFGNTEWTSHSNIRDISPAFLHLPFQAVECFMNIEPVDSDKGWTVEETSYFNQLVDGKFLVCVASECNAGANNITVELIETSTTKDIYISEAMVKANIAKARKPQSNKPMQQKTKISPYLPG
ncbi:uncharacterized protein [Watersipora subatra]|uniref:uncharacterized protein n=1 Tax=Watersipora subatra TaxID=2589382 RepID=UPI00355C92E7